MPDLSAAPFLQRALNRKDAMTARIKTQEEADLEQIAADVAAVGDALVAIMDRHRLLSERVRALLAGSCLGCTRYPGERHDDDCTLMVDPECDYCGADDDRHEPDCKPSYRTPALLSQDEADLVEKLTGTRYAS